MEILLTNDDGIDAPGLTALVEAVRGLGKLAVVAPRDPQSGASHSMCDRSALQVTAGTIPGVDRAHAVDGRPADCTRLGLWRYASQAAWVLSGINAGGNLGVDIYYSGTVGAAREAAILGRPAMALSQFIGAKGTLDWPVAARWARHVIEAIMDHPHQPGVLWNINLPEPQANARPEIHLVPMATASHILDYDHDTQADGRSVFQYRGNYRGRPTPAGTDVSAVFSGHIAVTPVVLDASQTAHFADLTIPPLPA